MWILILCCCQMCILSSILKLTLRTTGSWWQFLSDSMTSAWGEGSTEMHGIFLHYVSYCSCSGDFPTITADDFESNLMKILQKISGEIPRVFVNLVEVFNISQASNMKWNQTTLNDIVLLSDLHSFKAVWVLRDFSQNTSNWVWVCICCRRTWRKNKVGTHLAIYIKFIFKINQTGSWHTRNTIQPANEEGI